MKRFAWIGILVLLAFMSACDTTTREARRLVKRAELLADTLPDSTTRLIDSVLRMPASFSERERMDLALLQAEALFGDHGQDISPVMDDDFFDEHTNLSTSPELKHTTAYYARKKHYAKAAHAALYNGFVQQHYEEKEEAMRSFKEAEQYGGLAGDSLTMAQAQYRMGKMLLDDGLKEESLAMLQTASLYFGDHIVDKALVLNMMGVCYMLQGDVDDAESCLKQGLLKVGKYQSNSSKANLKLLNNYAVLYRLQGEYDKAVNILRQMLVNSNLNENEFFMLKLNLGNVYFDKKVFDSATLYYNRVVELLHSEKTMPNTQLAAYTALSLFAVSQNNDSLALFYREKHEELLYTVIKQRQEQNIYRIQRQYDYESLQNAMNQKIIWRHRIILVISVVAIMGLIAFALSRVKLAQTRKEEAETKANLFHFMQQNKELTQRSEEQKQNQIYLTQKHKESEQAYVDLLKEKEKQEQNAAEYGEKLSVELKKEQAIMLRLHLFLGNRGDEELLKKLEKTVFGKQAHLDAMMENVDRLYPQLREIIKQEDLGLDENEQLDVIMSYFNISRQDEALLLNKTIDMVDKIRNRSRKKIQSASEGNNLPQII